MLKGRVWGSGRTASSRYPVATVTVHGWRCKGRYVRKSTAVGSRVKIEYLGRPTMRSKNDVNGKGNGDVNEGSILTSSRRDSRHLRSSRLCMSSLHKLVLDMSFEQLLTSDLLELVSRMEVGRSAGRESVDMSRLDSERGRNGIRSVYDG